MKSCAPSTVGGCQQPAACDSTMERLMANPMPVPCGLVVKNAEKI
jgi:hypothetical protein